MKVIPREQVEAMDDYADMMKNESHHDHPIVKKNGVLRWQRDLATDNLVNKIGLNDIIILLRLLGQDKNSEIYRRLCREIGYSLSGYYDIFYWNNSKSDEYVQPASAKSSFIVARSDKHAGELGVPLRGLYELAEDNDYKIESKGLIKSRLQ